MNLYRTVKDKKPFNAPSFLWGNPTYVGDLAQAVLELLIKKADGIFHVVGSSFINRFEWARKACQTLDLDHALIKEMTEPAPAIAPRPLRSNLSAEKFKASYETALHDVSDGLRLMKSDMENSCIQRAG